jgi:hypothetical protein
VEGLDAPAEKFRASMLEHDALRVYVLAGQRTTLVWCRDRANDWRSELEQERSPATLRNVEIAVSSPGQARVYDPWNDRWAVAQTSRSTVTIPELTRSAVIRLSTAKRG